jgi:hypothetical protein
MKYVIHPLGVPQNTSIGSIDDSWSDVELTEAVRAIMRRAKDGEKQLEKEGK